VAYAGQALLPDGAREQEEHGDAHAEQEVGVDPLLTARAAAAPSGPLAPASAVGRGALPCLGPRARGPGVGTLVHQQHRAVALVLVARFGEPQGCTVADARYGLPRAVVLSSPACRSSRLTWRPQKGHLVLAHRGARRRGASYCLTTRAACCCRDSAGGSRSRDRQFPIMTPPIDEIRGHVLCADQMSSAVMKFPIGWGREYRGESLR
jgi:hypothetical protein